MLGSHNSVQANVPDSVLGNALDRQVEVLGPDQNLSHSGTDSKSHRKSV